MPTDHQADELSAALRRFGLHEFRPGQREVIEAICAGHDCLCIMPTGGGKSLCYQLPSMVRDGLTIVVSPLIALMKDQVDALRQRDIPATLINSSLTPAEQQERLMAAAAGKYRMVYVAPERLRNNRFLDAIRATPIQLLAVDEAHCISQWGHDFRPDYARIGQFREWLGGVQTVALTATATPRVREDIIQTLRLRKTKQFMSGFARPNLHFGVRQLQSDREKLDEIEQFLEKNEGAGIIYCSTRKRCEAVVEHLRDSLHIPAGVYHAGLVAEQRRVIQDRFMNNDLRVIVATNAFGMGIDKPDLRFVIHFNIPGSLEAYYQEAGRAGRDGKHSVCVLLHSYQDRYIQEFFIDNRYPPPALIEQVYDYLRAIDEDPIEMTAEEIKDALGVSVSAEAIGSCLKILARTRVLERLEAGRGMARVWIDSTLPTLVDLLPREAKVQRRVLYALERAVGDRRGEEVFVRPEYLLQETGLGRSQLARALRELSKLEQLDYVPPFRGRATHFRRRDVEFSQLEIDFEGLQKMKQMELERLNQVVAYAQSPLCRQKAILEYFGDPSAAPCGVCDRCQRRRGWPTIAPLSTFAKDVELTATSSAADAPAPAAKGLRATEDEQTAGELEGMVELFEAIIDAIRRIHGRVGRGLIAQFLCGSQSTKVQRMGLSRLPGFGMLHSLRQADAATVVDILIQHGILVQQEVTRNRPTVAVAAAMANSQQARELLSHVKLPQEIRAVMMPLARKVRQAQQEARRHATPRGEAQPMVATDVVDSAVTRATQGLIPEERIARPPADALDSRRVVEVGAASDPATESTPKTDATKDCPGRSQSVSDFVWTLMLFRQGADWQQVQVIRRMSDEEVADSLCAALKAGKRLDAKWLRGAGGGNSTPGQQRVARELRRRLAAGLH
ncbi:MAG: helicase [Pirellulaceae bacterium]|nr:MAG: helicase [Pirellulaceae bacterium]